MELATGKPGVMDYLLREIFSVEIRYVFWEQFWKKNSRR